MINVSWVVFPLFGAIFLSLGKFHTYYLHGKAGPKLHFAIAFVSFLLILGTVLTTMLHAATPEFLGWMFSIALGLLGFAAFLLFFRTPPKRIHHGPVQPARALLPPRRAKRQVSRPTDPAEPQAQKPGVG
jgi:hypothetical protein